MTDNELMAGYNTTHFGGVPFKHRYGEGYGVAQKNSDKFSRKVMGLVASTCAVAMISQWAINAPLPSPTSPNIGVGKYFENLAFRGSKNLESVLAKLISFVSYEPNWDGYSGITPSSKAIDDAITFIKKLPGHLFFPRPGIAGDGEVGLFWETNKIFIDVGFIGDGKYSFYAKDSEGKEFFGDEIDVFEGIDMQILNLLPSV